MVPYRLFWVYIWSVTFSVRPVTDGRHWQVSEVGAGPTKVTDETSCREVARLKNLEGMMLQKIIFVVSSTVLLSALNRPARARFNAVLMSCLQASLRFGLIALVWREHYFFRLSSSSSLLRIFF